jgi:histone-lysine N-methyltransferase SETMAR
VTERLEQGYCIKFCQKLGDTQVKTIHKIQQAFGDVAMRISRIKKWFNRFKVMLTVFFGSRGVVHHKYAPQGTTITKEYYQEVLHRLRDSVRRKRPHLWAATTWQLHHDNASAHSSHLIKTFLAKYSITVVRQALYSPDMAPCDFSVFPKL